MNAAITIEAPGGLARLDTAATTDWGRVDFEAKELRQVLGSYPTGVAIVVTRTPEGRNVGLTINSFASLSLDPPLVLWSLVRHSPNLAVFRDCRHFTINVLGSDQEALARRFANPTIVDKFEGVAVREAPEGVSALQGSVATLVCSSDQQQMAGDHLLLVGRVLRTDGAPADPLVFHAGRFAALHAPLAA